MDKSGNQSEGIRKEEKTGYSGWRLVGKIMKIAGIAVVCCILLIVLLLGGISLWLTPDRLAGIVKEQSEKYLDAEVNTGQIRFTLWSSFPRLHLDIDSICITSHTLKGLRPEDRKKLPDDADFLASASHFSGGINIIRLVGGVYSLTNVSVDSLRLNCVALNDSVTNYDIVRSKDSSPVNVPRISAESIALLHPQKLSYYSAATDTYADLRFSNAAINRIDKRTDTYRMNFKGLVSVKSENLEVLHRFPFIFSGQVGLAFRPFGLNFKDYTINLGNLTGKMNLDLKLGDQIKVKDFRYSLSSVDLMRLAQYLPAQYLPEMERIHADVGVKMTARLLKPYRYSPSTLPSIAVDIEIPRGKVSYDVADGSVYSVHDLNLDAAFVFDGDNPDASYFDIHNLSMSGYGSSMALSGSVRDLTTEPVVKAELRAVSDLNTFGTEIRELRSFGLGGKLTVNSGVTFLLNSLSAPQINDIDLKGNLRLTDYAFAPSAGPVKVSGDMIDLVFATVAPSVTALDIANSKMRLTGEANSLLMENAGGKKMRLNASGMKIDATLKGRNIDASEPLTGKVSASKVRYESPTDAMSLDLSGFSVAGNLLRIGRKYGTDLKLQSVGAALVAPQTGVNLRSLAAALHLRPSKKGIHGGFETPQAHSDSILLRSLDHTPEYLSFTAPESVKRIMDEWDFGLTLKAGGGSIEAPHVPKGFSWRDADLYLDNNSINVRSLALRAGETSMRLNGELKNLRGIICSSGPATIPLTLNMALDTVNINKLAYSYAGKHPDKGKTGSAIKPNDSVTMLVPRNLLADIRLSADETVYTNLHLYDLGARLSISEGNASIDYLNISSDFGKASMTLNYNTADVRNMGANATLDIDSINVVNFFKRFHALLEMMPQMANLSGYISARMEGNIPLFPTMYVNSPGITARAEVTGRDLKVHQTPFIRHITRMLLIPNDNDLHIKNMTVRADVSDNLLKLSPFNFEFENYRLTMAGLNNFNGDLYYHIGVDRSPVHIPFGINIEGHFDHPRLRFGGSHYKEKNAWAETENVQGKFRFNLTHAVRKFLKDFMHKAAQAATDPNLSL